MRRYPIHPDRVGDAVDVRREPARQGGAPGARPVAALSGLCHASASAEILALQRAVGNAAVLQLMKQPQPIHEVLRSPGKRLAEPVRAEMETRMGEDFADVRVHEGPAAKRSAAAIGARAYTCGDHIVVGAGGGDKHTLAHELTHVTQQRSGPVAGTRTSHGLSVSDPTGRFERAAEANATRVMRAPADPHHRAAPMPRHEASHAEDETIQRALDHNNQRQVGFNTVATPGPALAAWMLTDGSLVGGLPRADPPGYNYIRQLQMTMFWIRFHLVNEDAGGPGRAQNLVPASKRDNSRYLRDHEDALKREVRAVRRANNGGLVFYGVEVNYATQAMGTQHQQAEAPNFPTSLVIYHQLFDGGTWRWIENGVVFDFVDTQPTDPGTAPIQIANLGLDQLRIIAPTYRRWDNDDLAFLNSLGGGRRAEFEEHIDGFGPLGIREAVLTTFDAMPIQVGRNAMFGGVIGEQGNGTAGLEELADAIVIGRITI